MNRTVREPIHLDADLEEGGVFDVALLDYDLPPERIAAVPTPRREDARMLVVDRAIAPAFSGGRGSAQALPHGRGSAHALPDGRGPAGLVDDGVRNLPAWLRPGDLLVLNDTRVLPARFFLRRRSGGRIEALFLRETAPGRWEVMLKHAGRCRTDETLLAEPSPDREAGMEPSLDREAGIEDGHEGTEARRYEKVGSPIGHRRSAEAASMQVPGHDVTLTLIENRGGGRWLAAVSPPASAVEVLERVGRTPLPPYIRRRRLQLSSEPGGAGCTAGTWAISERRGASGENSRGLKPAAREQAGGENSHELEPAAREQLDRERYQTIYAARPGAVAAPTAGLHLTHELLDEIRGRGVETAFATLHVGPGTFKPLEVERIAEHVMHVEAFDLLAETAAAIHRTRQRGGRVVAVGTTVVRVLEHCAAGDGRVATQTGVTDIFIYPSYRFRVVDALLTNFHLPRSTLLALVMAFAGVERTRRAYAHAIARAYRFYSFGDAMLIV